MLKKLYAYGISLDNPVIEEHLIPVNGTAKAYKIQIPPSPCVSRKRVLHSELGQLLTDGHLHLFGYFDTPSKTEFINAALSYCKMREEDALLHYNKQCNYTKRIADLSIEWCEKTKITKKGGV